MKVRQRHPAREKVGAERHPFPCQSEYQTLLAHPGCHLHPREREEPAQCWRPALTACQRRCCAGRSVCSITLQMIPPIQISWDKPSGSNTNRYSQGKTCIRVASWQGISCCLICRSSSPPPVQAESCLSTWIIAEIVTVPLFLLEWSFLLSLLNYWCPHHLLLCTWNKIGHFHLFS